MFPLSLLSLKSIFSLSILLIAVGIGSFLYLTLNEDFEAKPRLVLRSPKPPQQGTGVSIGDVDKIINAARSAWSIVDNK